MHKATKAIVILALVSPMVSGCQSLGRALGLRSHDKELQARDFNNYAEQQMALGKQRLDGGQYAQAIEAFSAARAFPDQSAAAYNGLAIAYLQLGRPDLAERFFKQAMVIDPANRRYQANLARFYQSIPEAAVRTTREEAPALASVAPQLAGEQQSLRVMTSAGGRSTITVQTPADRLVRVSASEVVVGARSGQRSAPTLDGRRASGAVVGQAPQGRLNPHYHARVILGADASQVSAGGGYPVRIGLSATTAPAVRVVESAGGLDTGRTNKR